jgi:uncharacterized Fe-S radical SAM superfamily protein PflX
MVGLVDIYMPDFKHWSAERSRTYVNLMDQYCPARTVGEERVPELNRRLDPEEFEEARETPPGRGEPAYSSASHSRRCLRSRANSSELHPSGSVRAVQASR